MADEEVSLHTMLLIVGAGLSGEVLRLPQRGSNSSLERLWEDAVAQLRSAGEAFPGPIHPEHHTLERPWSQAAYAYQAYLRWKGIYAQLPPAEDAREEIVHHPERYDWGKFRLSSRGARAYLRWQESIAQLPPAEAVIGAAVHAEHHRLQKLQPESRGRVLLWLDFGSSTVAFETFRHAELKNYENMWEATGPERWHLDPHSHVVTLGRQERQSQQVESLEEPHELALRVLRQQIEALAEQQKALHAGITELSSSLHESAFWAQHFLLSEKELGETIS